MTRLTRLTVIAAGFDRARRQLEPSTRLPALERLVARGESQHRPSHEPAFQVLESWQRDVLRVISHPPAPSAPVSALGAGLAREQGTWLHAQFVHFAAGLDHLVLVPLEGAQALDAVASATLHAELAAHVVAESYEWLALGQQHFLHTPATLRAETCAPEAATRLPLFDAMPRGDDGRALRRLMTELQMQLHEHAVNRERARAGLLAANGVWLWGSGPQTDMPLDRALPQAFADDDYVRGLYRLHGAECQTLPEDGMALIERATGDVLVLLHCDSLPTLDARWLAPFERALSAGRIEQLELILDDMQLIATRWHRWRLWRRVRPLGEAHG